MTSAEREYQIQLATAAREASDNTEANSFLSFAAGAAWARKNHPPEIEALKDIIRKIIQSPQFDDANLIHRAEVALEAVDSRW